MAVPSSGQLSLRGLANEKVNNDYNNGAALTNISLSDLTRGFSPYDLTNTESASYPDSAYPIEMSDWYSYDHDFIATIQISPKQRNAFDACQYLGNLNTAWVTLAGSTLAVNDIIYTDAAKTQKIEGGFYKYDATKVIQVEVDIGLPPVNTGKIIAITTC